MLNLWRKRPFAGSAAALTCSFQPRSRGGFLLDPFNYGQARTSGKENRDARDVVMTPPQVSVSSAAADAFSLLPEHMTQLPKQPSNYGVSRMAMTHADTIRRFPHRSPKETSWTSGGALTRQAPPRQRVAPNNGRGLSWRR